jgi:nuclear pore complex protein Nup98-Nup96
MPTVQGGLFQNPSSGGFPASGTSAFGSTDFGGGGLFGNTANTGTGLNTGQSLFPGSTGFGNQQKPGFGTMGMGTTSFGMPTSQLATNLFGSPPAQTGPGGTSLFGNTSNTFMPTSAGQQTGMGGLGGGFGSSPGGFGGASTGLSTGMSSGFLGGTTGAFVSTGVGFGGGAALLSNQQRGTIGVPLKKVADVNGEVFRSILADDKFKNEDKSLEELRLEDYAMRKAGQVQFSKSTTGISAQPGGLNFGSTSFTSGGLLSTPQPQPQSTTSLFGSTGTNLFGQSTGQTSTLFGGTSTGLGTTQTSIFGQTTQNQPTLTGGLFGQTPASTTVGTGLFGPKPAGTTLFGTTSQPTTNTGGLFGTTSKPQTTLLGAPTGQTSLFGSTSGSLFGGTTNQTGIPGGSTGQGGLFGGSTAQTQLFGSTPSQGLTFTQQPNMPGQIAQDLTPDYSDPYGVKSYLADTANALKIDEKSLQALNKGRTPYDDEELISTPPVPVDRNWKYSVLTKITQQKEPETEFKPLYLYGSNAMPRGNMYGIRNELVNSHEQFKRLEHVNPKESLRLASRSKVKKKNVDLITLNVIVKLDNQEVIVTLKANKEQTFKSLKEKVLEKLRRSYGLDTTRRYRFLNKELVLSDQLTLEQAKIKNEDRIRLVMDLEEEKDEEVEIESASESEDEEIAHKLAAMELIPKPPKEGYRINPDYASLCRMSEDQLRNVSNFSIANEFGKIEFQGKVDLTGGNLRDDIVIRHREVVVYPEDSDKPLRGKKLNLPAIVTLFGCFPSKAGMSMENFKKKLLKICEKQDVSFFV